MSLADPFLVFGAECIRFGDNTPQESSLRKYALRDLPGDVNHLVSIGS